MAWTTEIFNPSNGQTIGVTERVLQVTTDEKLNSESNTFTVSCKNINEVHKFHHITIKKDGVPRYSGLILNQRDEMAGYKLTQFKCFDWSFICNIRVVAEKYLSTDAYQGRPDLILKHMFGKYAPELTTNNVDECTTTIEKLDLPYIYLMEAVKKVMKFLPGWYWYADASKDIHFFKGYESNGVTFGPDANGKYNFSVNSLTCDYIGDKAANRIWIVGPEQADPNTIDEYFEGDGVRRYFPLSYKPNYTKVYVGGVLKQSNLESNDDGNQDFLINKNEKVVYNPDYRSPFTGQHRINYRPSKQVIDFFENYPNRVETGLLIERVVKNKDIKDREEARQYGKAEIKRESSDKRIVNLITREDVSIGQRCSINVVINDIERGSWNIVGNFLVTSVSTSITRKETLTDEIFRSVELEEIV